MLADVMDVADIATHYELVDVCAPIAPRIRCCERPKPSCLSHPLRPRLLESVSLERTYAAEALQQLLASGDVQVSIRVAAVRQRLRMERDVGQVGSP